MDRRRFLAAAATLAAVPVRSWGRPDSSPLRIGLTPVFLDDQVGFLDRWHSYLEKELQRPVTSVQRGSYREIMDLLHQGKVDIAWVCGYPYIRNRRSLNLLAVPLFKGSPTYESYQIVPNTDASTKSLLDLRGKIFAFSDPDSNSGYLYPNYRLITLRERPQTFFAKSFFTWSHRKVVEAVASRVAHGGSVDGYIWDTLAHYHPELTARTRIFERSVSFGFPPFVARASLPAEIIADVRRVLVQMAQHDEGRGLLKELNLTGFTAGSEALFGGIERMARSVGSYNDAA